MSQIPVDKNQKDGELDLRERVREHPAGGVLMARGERVKVTRRARTFLIWIAPNPPGTRFGAETVIIVALDG